MMGRRVFRAATIFLLVIATPMIVLAADLFTDSGQRLGEGASWAVALADIDLDGDLDAVVANLNIGAAVWLNDGHGQFSDSGQRLSVGAFISIADLDGDGAPDVITASWDQPVHVWWNDGEGRFTQGDEILSPSGCFSLGIGDLNGNGFRDVFVGNIEADRLILNLGNRQFTDSGYRLGDAPTGGVAIGDMDGDGDLDVVAAGWDEPGHVWANDGEGTLTALSEFDAAALHVHGAVLVDAEGDGDLDVFFALAGGVCCRNLWLNDGTGALVPETFNLGRQTSQAIAVADLDMDGNQDVVLGVGTSAYSSPSLVWLGYDDGFTDSELRIGLAYSGGVVLGDLDGDGDQDLFIAFNQFVAGSGHDGHPNEVWMNTTAP